MVQFVNIGEKTKHISKLIGLGNLDVLIENLGLANN